MTRISYVTPYNYTYTSVYNHTRRRLEYWRSLGAEVDVHVMGRPGRQERSAPLNLWYDFTTSSDLIRRTRKAQPDVIYLRWLYPVPNFIERLSRIAPVVLDIHADDIAKHALGSMVRRGYVKVFRKTALSKASGGIFVTEELANSSSYTAVPGPHAVFPNGSDLERRKTGPPTSNVRVGLSVGGVLPWTGVDIFSQLAEKLPEAQFVIVAPEASRDALTKIAGNSVDLVFTSNHEQYIQELTTWTVGFGSLALQRAGLKVAAPLKVRDYVALGIPTVLPYFDQTLSQPGRKDAMILNIPTEAESVDDLDVPRIAAFIRRARGQQVSQESSRLISLTQIEAERMEFLRSF